MNIIQKVCLILIAILLVVGVVDTIYVEKEEPKEETRGGELPFLVLSSRYVTILDGNYTTINEITNVSYYRSFDGGFTWEIWF